MCQHILFSGFLSQNSVRKRKSDSQPIISIAVQLHNGLHRGKEGTVTIIIIASN